MQVSGLPINNVPEPYLAYILLLLSFISKLSKQRGFALKNPLNPRKLHVVAPSAEADQGEL